MLNSSFRARSSRAAQAAGFTLVELLVVIGIIAILAGVALGPITKGITKARESAAMQTTGTIALAEFQYQNDNGQYPDGTTAQIIATALINGGYISDPNTFYISADASAKKPAKLADFKNGNNNCSFDFAGVDSVGANAGPQGIPTSGSDLTPLVWTEGQTGLVIPQAADTGESFIPAGGIFLADGIAVSYKSNNAVFRSPNTNANNWPAVGSAIFVEQSYDPAGSKVVIRPGASGN